jgi:chromate reductase
MRKEPRRKVLAIAASLRAESWNGRLVAAAAALAHDGLRLTVFDDLAGVPPFDEDVEAVEPAGPGSVRRLREAVGRADGLLISTTEYNQSPPGVTKNLVDWLSRPDGSGALEGKPVAITGATLGPWGTRYAQKELPNALTAAGALVLPQPMLFVQAGAEAFDVDGQLINLAVRRRLADLLRAFDAWIGLVGIPSALAV